MFRAHYNKLKHIVSPGHRPGAANQTGVHGMQNRITVTIADQEYTFLASEEQEYMEKVAAHVDTQIRETLKGNSKMSLLDGASLTAMNLADERFKDQESADNLRRQLKDYLEESSKLKLELSEAKREIFKLQNQLNKK